MYTTSWTQRCILLLLIMSSKQGLSIVTADLIAKVENTPDLPPDTWYLICAAVLCALNEPTEVAALFKHLIHDVQGDLAEQKRLATRYREALIKLAPLSGMPKVPRLQLARLLHVMANHGTR